MFRAKQLSEIILFGFATMFLVACGAGGPTQTGGRHAVAPRFQAYYEARGGLDFFGFAISEERLENGVYVQYFQRMRLEYRPELPAGRQVRPSSLVQDDLVHRLNLSDAACIAAKDVKPGALFWGCHSILPDIQIYYSQIGGGEFLGLPISEAYEAGGMLTQHFENGSIVLDRTPLSRQGFRLGETGLIVFTKSPLPFRGGGPLPTPTTQVKSLRLSTSPAFPVLQKGQAQMLLAVVTDQEGSPIADAIVVFNLSVGYGSTTFKASPTNIQGKTTLILPAVELNSSNIIRYTALAVYVVRVDGKLQTLTATHAGEFMPWVAWGKP